MKLRKYSLLYFHHLIDKYSKWIFPLHDGENIIGSDKDVDIFLYLNEKEEPIESVHCKIILDEIKNKISIISLTDKYIIKTEEQDEIKMNLSPGKEYQLKSKSKFFLGENLKFMVINDTIENINNFFIEQRLENEYQKWKQLISHQESNIKINLNLTRKESLNKSFVSNKSNNNNNNNNLNNNNINNSLLRSNTKDENRIGFNNFDEVPDDKWLINENENFEEKNNNSDFSPFKQINSENKNNLNNTNNSNINPIKYSMEETPKISPDIKIIENNINLKEIKSIFHSKENNINNNLTNFQENLINNSNIISKENYDINNNILPLNKKENKFNEEKNLTKDENTAKIIKELLGENNLEIIIKNTDFKKIKKLDVFFKKANKAKIESGNFDIKFINKSNIFDNK